MGEGGLDAAQRSERAALLAQTYGPDAGGALDPQAAARLAELEATHRVCVEAAEPASAPAPARPSHARPSAAESLLPRTSHSSHAARREGVVRGRSDSASGARTPARGIRNRHALAVAVVASVGLVLGTAAAVRTIVASAPVPVTRLSVEPGAPGFLVGSSNDPPPTFPIGEEMLWSAPLGTVLGWDVWVGRSRSNYACLALVRSQTVDADCVSPADFAQSGVSIYLSPGDIATDVRPAELVGSAAVAYRWAPDRSVTVQVER